MSTATFAEFAERADYSLLEALTPDPESTADGEDHRPRQVLSGHYVPVTPTPIPEPQYLAHSRSLFSELTNHITDIVKYIYLGLTHNTTTR